MDSKERMPTSVEPDVERVPETTVLPEQDLLEGLLVEEVSIDGMCGVY